MSVVFLNGQFVNEDDAKVSINDCGYYFGDGVYEVILLYKGKLIDADLHLDRLLSCFKKVYFNNYPQKHEILENINELVNRNKDITTGSIYIQFTRGVRGRSHDFSTIDDLKPNCFIKMKPCELNDDLKKTWHCNFIEDPRRYRCDIKMTSLLPMVLSKIESERLGFDDVVYYNSRVNSVTEGSCFNVFIVTNDNVVVTYPIGKEILPGCTRARLISLIKESDFKIEERAISKEELFNAKEVFATGSLKVIIPITKISDITINDGKVGDVTLKLNEMFIDFLESSVNE